MVEKVTQKVNMINMFQRLNNATWTTTVKLTGSTRNVTAVIVVFFHFFSEPTLWDASCLKGKFKPMDVDDWNGRNLITHYGRLVVVHMGVSSKRGTPKWMVYNGKSYWNGRFGGTPIFGNTHIQILLGVIPVYPRESPQQKFRRKLDSRFSRLLEEWLPLQAWNDAWNREVWGKIF